MVEHIIISIVGTISIELFHAEPRFEVRILASPLFFLLPFSKSCCKDSTELIILNHVARNYF